MPEGMQVVGAWPEFHGLQCQVSPRPAYECKKSEHAQDDIGQGSQGPKQGKHLERPGHWSRLWGFQAIFYTNVHIATAGRA